MRTTAALLLTSLFLAGPAEAQQEDSPLAIPVGEEPPPSTSSSRDRPLALPGAGPRAAQAPMSPEKLKALRTYEAERLVIRGETELRMGAVPVVGWGWGWGWGPRPGWRHHTTVGVAMAPVGTSRNWGIYQGQERLSVPSALSLAGSPRLDQVQSAIRRKRTAATAWYTVAGVGGAALVGSIVGRVAADDRQEWATWYTVGVAGGVTGVVGLIAGSGPAADAQRLEYHPYRSMSLADARDMVDRHNDRLRERLGLTPAEVWSIENKER